MSLPNEEATTCKRCGWQQQFTVWDSLNVTLNPAQKEELIKGTLTRFVCEKCGSSSEVTYPMLYHDMTKKFMIQLDPQGGRVETGTLPMRGLMGKYRFRVVGTRSELIEKIIIFDADYDDRVVEYIKLLLLTPFVADGRPFSGKLIFIGRTQSDAGEPVSRFDVLTGEEVLPICLGAGAIEEYRAQLADKLPSDADEQGKWLKVDQAYAIALINR